MDGEKRPAELMTDEGHHRLVPGLVRLAGHSARFACHHEVIVTVENLDLVQAILRKRVELTIRDDLCAGAASCTLMRP